MIACLLVSATRLAGTIRSASESPITACVLGLLVACVFSHLSHGSLGRAADDGFVMLKIITYYLLLIGLVDTPARLRSFLFWIVGYTVVLTGLALLHYHGMIQIQSLEAAAQRDVDPETGEVSVIPRLCSTGIFSDPNDLSMILVLATIACLFFFDNTPGRFARYLWLAPPGVFLFALKLTYSRGGLINLALSLLILCRARLGWKKTIGIYVLALPVMIALFGGRQTRIDPTNKEDTSQARIQLWSEGFDMFREAPLFGVGMNEYGERGVLVAHNSFVHTYAELGFIGGTFFAGAFYAALSGLKRLGNKAIIFSDPIVMKLRPYIWTMICSYCVGMLSLSRPYTLTTYVVLGIAGAYLRIAEPRASIAALRFDSSFVQRMLVVGAACVIGFYVFVRVMVRW